MNIKEIDKKPDIGKDKKLMRKFSDFEKLINELKKREVPSEIVNSVNQDIDDINALVGSNRDLLKQLRKKQSGIMKLIEKELKLVTKNYYRNLWLALGMAFGIPFGVVFGISLDNMAFLGIGIPIGMAIGIAIGTAMDKKALDEGRQLDLEVEY
jgi:F0F1-type ATP synthase assembly protein I